MRIKCDDCCFARKRAATTSPHLRPPMNKEAAPANYIICIAGSRFNAAIDPLRTRGRGYPVTSESNGSARTHRTRRAACS